MKPTKEDREAAARIVHGKIFHSCPTASGFCQQCLSATALIAEASAPTLALMARLVELVEMFHPAGDTVPHKDCDPCQAITDYKAFLREQL